MFNVLDSLKPHAHWLLRIGLADVFIYHGIGKVMNFEGFSQMMGLPTTVAKKNKRPFHGLCIHKYM